MRFSLAAAAAAILLLGGCHSRIQHGLDERQANELQTVLLERGLSARKVQEEGKKPTWSIEVDDAQAADAVRILSELGLPRPRTEGFSEVFGKGSLVPTPTEERALYLQALSGELAQTLEAVEGVTSARVHLALPPPPRPGQQPGQAKASAFLRVRPGAAERVGASRDELRALLAGSVEGLAVDGVTLVINEVSTSVSPTSAPQGTVIGRLRVLIIALGGVLSLLAMIMVVLSLRLRHYRRLAADSPRSVPAPVPAKPVVSPTGARKAA